MPHAGEAVSPNLGTTLRVQWLIMTASSPRLPSYEIGSELGRGACGVVLAGRHRQLGRMVAIKQLPRAFGADPAVRARFLAEARVLATLDHPHVVAIYDFVDHEGLCLLVMERLTGGTVWSRFHAGGFTPDVSCAILLAVCAGLHHAHQHGILHRDVKPENLMFSEEGTLKVTDLGIAKVIGGSSTLATRHGEILGTPAYIAPEQAQGYELTPATDVYAAGTLLYELLAGRLPFPADSDPATILYRHVHESPPPLLGRRARGSGRPRRSGGPSGVAIARGPIPERRRVRRRDRASARRSTWGRGWLARTNVPVSASGPILTAALGDLEPGDRPVVPTAVERAQPTNELGEPVAGDFLPIQLMHPEYRDADARPAVQLDQGAPPKPAAAETLRPAPVDAAASVAPASVDPVVPAPAAPPTIVDLEAGRSTDKKDACAESTDPDPSRGGRRARGGRRCRAGSVPGRPAQPGGVEPEGLDAVGGQRQFAVAGVAACTNCASTGCRDDVERNAVDIGRAARIRFDGEGRGLRPRYRDVD